MEEDLYEDLKKEEANADNNEAGNDIVEDEEEEEMESDESDIEIVLDQVERLFNSYIKVRVASKPAGLVSIKATAGNVPTSSPLTKIGSDKVTVAAFASGSTDSPVTGSGPKLDLTEVGQYKGKDIIDVDLDTEFQERPWRRPGADITDFFNYNFDEQTWKIYCQKQRALREQFAQMNSESRMTKERDWDRPGFRSDSPASREYQRGGGDHRMTSQSSSRDGPGRRRRPGSPDLRRI